MNFLTTREVPSKDARNDSTHEQVIRNVLLEESERQTNITFDDLRCSFTLGFESFPPMNATISHFIIL